VWKWTPDGQFTVASAYDLLVQRFLPPFHAMPI
jgi:hypothetical protein